MPTRDKDALLARLTSAYAEEFLPDGVTESNVSKFLDSFVEAIWSEIDGDFTQFFQEMYLPTMTIEAVMDKWAGPVTIRRNAGEGNVAFRVRIEGAIRRLRGGTKPDDILEFVETTLGLNPGDVDIVENDDGSGGYQPATFKAVFDPTAGTLGAGATAQEIQDAVDSVTDTLSVIAAAGVLGQVETTSGGQYDVDKYDEGLYGGATTI